MFNVVVLPRGAKIAASWKSRESVVRSELHPRPHARIIYVLPKWCAPHHLPVLSTGVALLQQEDKECTDLEAFFGYNIPVL